MKIIEIRIRDVPEDSEPIEYYHYDPDKDKLNPEYCYYKTKYCTDKDARRCHICREFNTRYKGRFN